MEILKGQVNATHDPRLYDHGSEWRDSVRQQLSMFQLKVNICLITMSSTQVDGIVVFDSVNRSTAVLWSDILQMLRSDLDEAEFSIRLCPLDDVEIEEHDYPYEFQGVPINLKDDIAIIDNELVPSDAIVTSRPLHDPFTNTSP
jgi:hypothetical protein